MPSLLLPPPFSFINTTLILFLSLFFFFLIPTYATSDAEGYKACAPFSCGNFTNIRHPFWSNDQPDYCGRPEFKLNCQQPNLTIEINSQMFRIIDINQNRLLKIARLDLSVGITSCPNQYINVSLDLDFFKYTSIDENQTLLFDCVRLQDLPTLYSFLSSEVSGRTTCLIDGDQQPHEVYLVPSTEAENFRILTCQNNITVPVLKSSLNNNSTKVNVNYVLGEGFEVGWIDVDGKLCDGCWKSGGRCGYNASEDAFLCLCPHQSLDEFSCLRSEVGKTPTSSPSRAPRIYNGIPPRPSLASAQPPYVPNWKESPHGDATSTSGSQFNWKRKLVIGVGSAVTAALLMCIIICYFRSKMSIRHVKFRLTTKNDKGIEAFLTNHAALSQKRYKFSEVKKMTNSFKVKLGHGGFGAVYKGKLFNGCPVAIKIINASKGNGEEFINEVASISRTSHVNIVTLLGFCFEGCKKALIYEFMPNGSLDKFIYNEGPKTIASLGWEDLYQIAKGIARGLEYLHRGCTTRILHFDIKPHNILLDENFCPKISDFGLAKLCHRKESIISMPDARGTMGYVAPEVGNRHFGGVSHKSDVYSYGMMLLEMVGGRKNINAEASHTSEIFFPHWVYTRLQLGSDLRHDGVIVTDTEEDEIVRRMTIVGLWCIQTFPNDRPTMSRVIEMLEGNMNSLEIPPKPLFSSPTRSESESST